MNRVCAPDRLYAGLGKAEVFHLARLNQVFDSAGHVLDRNAWIDAMLMEQVDGIDLGTFELGFRHGLDTFRPAVYAIRGFRILGTPAVDLAKW